MQSELLTVSGIAKRTTINYVSARTHLETLENGNILTHVMFGKRIRYYKFKDSPSVRNLLILLVLRAVYEEIKER
jgi:ribosomal protein S25